VTLNIPFKAKLTLLDSSVSLVILNQQQADTNMRQLLTCWRYYKPACTL